MRFYLVLKNTCSKSCIFANPITTDNRILNMEQNPITSKARIVWLDGVRLAAMLMLVCCHATGPFNYLPDTTLPEAPDIKFWGALWGAAMRPCVPLFVMLTGALLLPVKTDATLFCRKHIFRVLWPFLIWSAAYSFLPWLAGLADISHDTAAAFMPYAGDAINNRTLAAAFNYILQIPFNNSPLAVPMWYIYLLIGLYLYMPIFSAWVKQASRRSQRRYLLLWGVTLCVPFWINFVRDNLWGLTPFNEFGMLYYFAGFNGYLLLGHYLRNTNWTRRFTFTLCPPLFVAGYIIVFSGFRWVCSWPDATDRQIELFFLYGSPGVLMMSVAAFMTMKAVRITSPRVQSRLANLTACGFGIYMIHYFFSGPMVVLLRTLNVPLFAQVPLSALLTLSVSWGIVSLCKHCRKRWSVILFG